MRLLLAAAVLIACVAWPAGASARAVRPPLPTPLPAVTRAPCPGFPDAEGCEVGPLQVYVNDGRLMTKLHEFGHVVDDLYLDVGERNRFRTLLGLREQWDGANDLLDTELGTAPTEVFADAYARCRHQSLGSGWSTFAPPNDHVYREVCGFIARAMRTTAAAHATSGPTA